jgi:hypothetical protein
MNISQKVMAATLRRAKELPKAALHPAHTRLRALSQATYRTGAAGAAGELS